MDQGPRRRRRDVLRALGVVGGVTLAGCLDRLGIGGHTVDGFPYAAGFSPEGVDPFRAFGPGSVMASVDSLTIERESTTALGPGHVSQASEARFDAVGPRFVRNETRFNSLTRELTLTDGFFNGLDLIERIKVEPRSLDFSHRASPHMFSRSEDFRLTELAELLLDVDVTVDAIDSIDGVPVARYRASTADFRATSALREAAPELSDASVELHVDERGLVRSFRIEATIHGTGGDDPDLASAWRYSAFDETAVVEPPWIEALAGIERPRVDVDFVEEPGAYVRVEVHSMEATSHVAIVIEDDGVYDDMTEPAVVEIPFEDYVVDDAGTLAIFVFADNELRGPIQVAAHQPNVGP